MERAIEQEGVGSNLRDALARLHEAHVEQSSNGGRDVGRWKVKVDGYHYRIIREGEPRLTPREGEVVERVMRGLSNKCIAYELGIAHATVRVLLHRAMGKIGVGTRVELEARLRSSVETEVPAADDVVRPSNAPCVESAGDSPTA